LARRRVQDNDDNDDECAKVSMSHLVYVCVCLTHSVSVKKRTTVRIESLIVVILTTSSSSSCSRRFSRPSCGYGTPRVWLLLRRYSDWTMSYRGIRNFETRGKAAGLARYARARAQSHTRLSRPAITPALTHTQSPPRRSSRDSRRTSSRVSLRSRHVSSRSRTLRDVPLSQHPALRDDIHSPH